MTEMLLLVSSKIEKALKKTGLICKPCSKGYHLSSEKPLSCPGLTVTSLDVKGNWQIFIGTLSLEQAGTERGVIGDVMYLSVYLVWQSPQVCWVLVSTGTSESKISFITSSHLPAQTHDTHFLSLKVMWAHMRTHTHTVFEGVADT